MIREATLTLKNINQSKLKLNHIIIVYLKKVRLKLIHPEKSYLSLIEK